MTAIRKSYLIAIEDGFGTGIAKDGKWWPVPQGFYFAWNSNTQATSLYGTGAKIRQNSIYGQFQGSWNASWVMDFNHLEFLSILFDTYDNDEPIPLENPDPTTAPYAANFETDIDGCYEHVFRKLNSRRQISYVIKERVLNIIAGGQYDEENLIKGVLARNINQARSTQGSQMALEMTGVFADKWTELYSTKLDSFYTPLNDPLTQYSCMYMGTDPTPEDEDAIEQVDSHSISIETNVSLVYSTCSPIATDFYEDRSTFAWNASAYMNNPTKKFKLLSNSGGTLEPHTLYVTQDGKHAKQPMGKNLAPLEYVNFITYDESYRDAYSDRYDSIVGAYLASQHVVWIQARNSTVKTSSTPKGDGSKLQDTLSSVECDEIIIRVRNNKPMIWNDSDQYVAGAGGGQIAASEVKFTQSAISQVSPEITFPVPVEGFAPPILGLVFVDCSEDQLSDSIVLNGENGQPDLRGYVVIENVAMGCNGDSDAGITVDQYRLDNLVPKQLTDAGEGPSGLTVQTEVVVAAEAPLDTLLTPGEEPEPAADQVICPVISGTPLIKRTDYYFIVKEYIPDGETDPVYSTGYLRVAVR